MLDNQFFAYRHREVRARWQHLERATELIALERHPRRRAAPLRQLDRLDDYLLRPALFRDADHLVYRNQIRRNGHHFAVDLEMAVADQLAGLRERTRKPEPIHHVIEPALEQHEQILAGYSRHAFGHFKVMRELSLLQSVNPLYLL